MAENKWEPVVGGGIGLKSLFGARPATSSPLMMRKRDRDGKWIYRDPRPEEIEDYLSSEAW